MAHELQLALAVRTWADPTLLLDKSHADSERRRALEMVGPLCDIGIGPEAGKWFLRINARQRLTAHMEASEAEKAVADAPKDDPITRALGYLLAVETAGLDSFSSRELAVLREVQAWAERWVRRPVGDIELRRRIARKLLVENFQQQLPAGFVGREAELKKISEVLLAPPKTSGTPAASRFFIHGQGGVGKSSFVAELGLRLVGANSASLLAVLDFDRADLDPLRHATLDFDFLSQLATADENAVAALGPLIARIRKQRSPDSVIVATDEDNSEKSSDDTVIKGERSLPQPDDPALESVDFEAKSLALQGGGFENLGNRPVILFLDTFERVEETESTAVSSVVRWLSTLATIHKIDDLRIVISGRNDPDEGGSSWSSLPIERVQLGPLSTDESRELFQLLAQESSPAQDRLRDSQFLETVVKVSQGIPLIIRLIVGLLEHLDDEDVAEILKSDGTLPASVVQGMLYDRTLKHIPHERARLYAHPGLVLPRLDVDLIHKVLAPMVERERKVTKEDAEAIFSGLQQPRWLTLVSADGRSLRARPDLRSLLLGLMDSDPKRAAEIAEVRGHARIYHAKKRGSRHQAYRFYYDLLAVQTRDDLTVFEGLELGPYLSVLREHIADLPPVAQHFLKGEQGRKLALAEAAKSLPDRAWARYLAGADGVRGEGERIVERADPMLVLPVWRERPTGERGRPPTFVIQALAETGEWRTEEVDVGAIVSELRETLAGSPPIWRNLLKRLYWLTRYALLAHPGPLAEDHAALLREVLDRSSPAPAISALPSIAAVADAFAGGRDPILVDAERWLSTKIDSPGRLRFVLGAFGDTSALRDFRLPNSRDTHIFQADWPERLESLDHILDDSSVQQLAKRFRDLKPDPSIVDLEAWSRESGRIPLLVSSVDPRSREAILLLRGLYTEFHLPIRQALKEAFRDAGKVRNLIALVRNDFTVWPTDFDGDRFIELLERDPVAWFLSLTRCSDQARVLDKLLAEGARLAPESKLPMLARHYRQWDQALTFGVGSYWWHDRAVPLPAAEAAPMQVKDSSQAAEYTRTADLPPHSADGTGRDVGFDFNRAQDQALVVGSNIVSFLRGVDEQLRGDIVNSLILAQLVATKKVGDQDDIFPWYEAYFETLSNIGWTVQERQFVSHRETTSNLDVQKAILTVATTLFGPGSAALQVVTASLDAFKSMNEDSPSIALFNRESQHAKAARFQVSLAEADADGRLMVSHMAFAITARTDLTQVLFFRYRSTDIHLRHSSAKTTIDTEVLAGIREVLQQKVQAYTDEFVKQLPDL